MEISKKIYEEKPKNLWKSADLKHYQVHVKLSSPDSTTESEEKDERVVYMEDLEKRKKVYGICGECNEPGTGFFWCQPCNAKRFKDNFKNWTSGNQDIDKLIQQSQLNAVSCGKFLEWIPFENFKNVKYIASGGFGKIYSANWPEGYIYYWNIENQEWKRNSNRNVALKSLDNSSNISAEFLNEIEAHLQVHLFDVVQCRGITLDPVTKNYMMILKYCEHGNLKNYLNKSKSFVDYNSKIQILFRISRGLLDIHDAGKVHKDFHSGNILFSSVPFISDLGMCQPANNEVIEGGVYGVIPYMAPEVLRGYQYTKASDIYSFGIVINELISEETPFNDIPHDHFLAINICKGIRPKIHKSTPKLLKDLIIKCWDTKAENRPTVRELHQILKKWAQGNNEGSEISLQIKNYNRSMKQRFKNKKNIQSHPQAIYTSRLLNLKNLPEPENSSDLTSFQFNYDANYASQSELTNQISECFDTQLSESDLNEINQDNENNTDE
ncbi:kinase-like domain-containing protein [Glomus cerebriforme]|uniref:Kinase-like domain-containing protein n=1 Tax=Glomus cerebriforme TaxID=658196 RepID=A0A397SNV2_9GLOM|nr:kinase-like domain-containing protein [Glomus cerebriforme]